MNNKHTAWSLIQIHSIDWSQSISSLSQLSPSVSPVSLPFSISSIINRDTHTKSTTFYPLAECERYIHQPIVRGHYEISATWERRWNRQFMCSVLGVPDVCNVMYVCICCVWPFECEIWCAEWKWSQAALRRSAREFRQIDFPSSSTAHRTDATHWLLLLFFLPFNHLYAMQSHLECCGAGWHTFPYFVCACWIYLYI